MKGVVDSFQNIVLVVFLVGKDVVWNGNIVVEQVVQNVAEIIQNIAVSQKYLMVVDGSQQNAVK